MNSRQLACYPEHIVIAKKKCSATCTYVYTHVNNESTFLSYDSIYLSSHNFRVSCCFFNINGENKLIVQEFP